MTKDPLIIALDFDSAADARTLINVLGTNAAAYKVGMELYASAGPDLVRGSTGRDTLPGLRASW